MSQTGKASSWQVPQKAGASEMLTERWATEAGVFGDLPGPRNLERTARESEAYPATHEPQAIRADTGGKQPVSPLTSTSQLHMNPARRDRSRQEGCAAEEHSGF